MNKDITQGLRPWLIALTVLLGVNVLTTAVFGWQIKALLEENTLSSAITPSPLTSPDGRHPWPMFHGTARHSGLAAVTGPPTASLKWKVLIGKVQGNSPNSVAIAEDGTIYVAGAN